jgi:hypothetical protein
VIRWVAGSVALALGCAAVGCTASGGNGDGTGAGGTSWSGGGGAGGEGANGGDGGTGAGDAGMGGSGATGGAPGGSGGEGGTGPAPTVISTIPVDGETGVSEGATVSFTFSGAMDPATITASTSGTSCTGTLQLSTDGFATCVPMAGAPNTLDSITFEVKAASVLAPSEHYDVRVTTAAQSAGGVPLAAPYETATGMTVRYFHTIVVDGSNDFAAADQLATSTTGAALYVSFDSDYLYLGLAHADVVVGGGGNKFVYFLFSTDAALATGNTLSGDGKAKFGAAGSKRLAYQWKERIDGPSYSEYRLGSAADWSGDWTTANKSAFRAAGYLEGAIALTELGSPTELVITAYTVDYNGFAGAGALYNMLAGAVDGSAAEPRDLVSYLGLTLPTSTAPNATALSAF